MQRTGIAADRGWAGNLRATRPELYANPPDLPKHRQDALLEDLGELVVISPLL